MARKDAVVEVPAILAASGTDYPERLGPPPVITFEESAHRYTLDGEFVPSVTSIIKTSDPFEAGPWWGMRVAIAGIARMIQTGQLSYSQLMSADPDKVLLGHAAEIEDALTEHKLTVNHVRQERADEGLAIHYAIEQVSQTGALPQLADFDPELRGFIQAFARYVSDQDPEILFHETILASRQHRYAGRTDIGIGRWDHEADLPAVSLEDFKTTRNAKGCRVYDSYMLQNTAYRMGYNELLQWAPAGTPRCVEAATVVLHDNGSYLRETTLCPDARWLAAVALWWENEPFLDALATRRNKSGKRRKR